MPHNIINIQCRRTTTHICYQSFHWMKPVEIYWHLFVCVWYIYVRELFDDILFYFLLKVHDIGGGIFVIKLKMNSQYRKENLGKYARAWTMRIERKRVFMWIRKAAIETLFTGKSWQPVLFSLFSVNEMVKLWIELYIFICSVKT